MCYHLGPKIRICKSLMVDALDSIIRETDLGHCLRYETLCFDFGEVHSWGRKLCQYIGIYNVAPERKSAKGFIFFDRQMRRTICKARNHFIWLGSIGS